MLKTRIILFVSAVLLVVIIFSLPKVVVDNEDNKLTENSATENTPHSNTPSEENLTDVHTQKTPAEIQKKIDKLKITINDSDVNEKNTIFADSLAELYLSINKYDSAAKFIEIIAENIPNEANWLRAGNTYYEAYGFAMNPQKRAEMGEKAREYLNKVLDASPDNLAAKNKVAMTHLSTSNPMKGITMLREILQADPENEDAIFNLGVLSMQSNQYGKAVERFSQLTEKYPENMQGQFFLGVSYLETGNREKAKEQFELVKSLSKDPEVQATVDSYLEELK